MSSLAVLVLSFLGSSLALRLLGLPLWRRLAYNRLLHSRQPWERR